MRVIGGELRSRRIRSLEGMRTRPTPDRLRETLFDILGSQVEGCVFADLCAGSGAVGIEALSRGAERCVFVESDPRAARTIAGNLKDLALEECAEVIRQPARLAAGRLRADIVFLDPPYEDRREFEELLDRLGETGALVIAQHDRKAPVRDTYRRLRRWRIVTQGSNCLSFFAP